MGLDIDPEQLAFLASKGLTVGAGMGRDMDQAWDSLHSSCQEGAQDAPSRFLLADPSDISVTGEGPLNATAALLRALNWGVDAEVGKLAAWPVAPRSAFTRRKQVTLLEDAGLTPPVTGVPLELAGGGVRDFVLEQEGGGSETLERLQLLRHSARYSVAAQRGEGASASVWVLKEGDRVLPQEYRTAGEARRGALALIKGLEGHDLPRIDVVKIVARESGPVWSLTRTRVAQKIRLRATWASPKRESVPCAGWVFALRSEP